MNIQRTALPGIGVRHTITTAARQRLAVLSHHTGRRDIVLYDPEDPERASCTVVLDSAEARDVADLLNATVTVDHIAALEAQLTGVFAARIRVPAGSGYADRPLRDLESRGDAAIVAVVRDNDVVSPPGHGFVIRHDDTVVAVGSNDGIVALTAALNADRSHR